MNVFQLLFKIRADTSDMTGGMKNASDAATKTARGMMKDFRTGFTTFFSVSALRTMVLQTMEFAKNFENVREEVEGLGISVDENVLKKAQLAEAGWRQFVFQLRVALMHALPYIADVFHKITGWVQKAGAFWGAIFGGSNIREAVKAMEQVEKEAAEKRRIAEERVQIEQQRIIEERERKNSENYEAKTKKFEEKIGDTFISKMMDNLGTIGGFRARSQVDSMRQLSSKQLDTLKSIDENTSVLKGGIV